MRQKYLNYPLVDGYIHNWLVAGPQAIEVQELHHFTGPDYKLQIAQHYYQPEVGLDGEPVEYGDFQAGDFSGKWRYLRTRHDHLVDCSVFHHLTHYLRAWAYTEIESPLDQELAFILTSNGPADLWINGEHVHRQEHFYHQIPKRAPFQARLKAGTNSLMVRFEEVAARECPYGLALQVKDMRFSKPGEALDEPSEEALKVVRIPTLAPDPLRRMKLELLFEACHIRKDVYARKDEIMVYLPESPATHTDFTIRLQTPSGGIFGESYRKSNMGYQQSFGFPYQTPEGDYQLIFMPTLEEYYQGNVRVTRARQFFASTNLYSTQPYGSYEERRQEALKDAARRKDNVFSEIAKMELGKWSAVNVEVVLKTIEGINRRRDCSDFYLCGLLGALYRYVYVEAGEIPAEAGAQGATAQVTLSDRLRQPLEECVLNFKYWQDEPGSDAMCYTTENHSILFHTCEVLAGQLYPERIFSNANQRGQWHQEKGERLALEWLRNRARTGFKEWDSNTYFEEDTLALATLADLAENPEVYELATLLLDKLFYTIALNSFKGVFGSTHGRSYTPYIKTGFREGTSGISRLLWGMGIFNDRILGLVGLACSSYELPPILAAIAADQPAEMWSKEQHTGDEQDFRNSGSAGAGVNKVTYKTPDYMLCSAQDWHPGEFGYQQHIWQATLSPQVTIFTSHPPNAAEDSSHRPNYWHGNLTLPRVAQWKDVLVAIYNFTEDDWMGFTHAYFPAQAMDEHVIKDQWAFGKVGEGYIALTAARGLDFQTRGDNAYRDLRSPSTPNIWVCQMGRAALDGSFPEFIQKVLALPVKFDGTPAPFDNAQGSSDRRLSVVEAPAPFDNAQGPTVEFTSLRGEALRFDWQGPLWINDQPQPLSDFKHYDSPYSACELNSPVMEITFGGETLRLHFEDD